MPVVTFLYIIVSKRGVREVRGFYSVQHDVQIFLYSVPDLRFIVITARKVIFLVIHFYSGSSFFYKIWAFFLLYKCWLEVSIRKVLRPATSAQVFLGFPVSVSECWDGSQDSKLLLHDSYVALPT
jgi:hypothetical protein